MKSFAAMVLFSIGAALLTVEILMWTMAEPESTKLPHRLHGLDPQGHLIQGEHPTGERCPGQYEEWTYTPTGLPKFFIGCWGRK